MFAITIGRASPGSFEVLIGIVWLAIVASFGIRSVLAALIAGILYAVVPQLFAEHLPTSWAMVPTLLFGLGAIRLAVNPRGSLFDIQHSVRVLRLRRARRAARARESGPRMSELLLEAHDVAVSFGGVAALAGVDLAVPARSIVGLVGPNGAGKTTLFGVLSGLLSPRTGRVELAGVDVTRSSPQRRARLGLARTFQRLELFDELTVRDHLVVARRIQEHRDRTLLRDLAGLGRRPSPGEDDAVDALLELLELGEFATQPVPLVPLGTGRVVELARALATEPRVVLLDEPTSGLDVHETERVAARAARRHAPSGASPSCWSNTTSSSSCSSATTSRSSTSAESSPTGHPPRSGRAPRCRPPTSAPPAARRHRDDRTVALGLGPRRRLRRGAGPLRREPGGRPRGGRRGARAQRGRQELTGRRDRRAGPPGAGPRSASRGATSPAGQPIG